MSKLKTENVLKIKQSRVQNAIVKQQLQEMTDAVVSKSVKSETQRLIIAMNILDAYQRNHLLGHGKKRIIEYIEKSDELQKRIFERYDDADLFFMEKHLKEVVGVDVRKFLEERWKNEDG